MTRPLGVRQRGCLSALSRHRMYPSDWKYGTHRETVLILESLVKRGLVEKVEQPSVRYYPTEAGAVALRESPR